MRRQKNDRRRAEAADGEPLAEGPLRQRLLTEFNIEVAGGLGELAGKAWRIGLMGHSCRKESVEILAGVLNQLLAESSSLKG